MRVTGFVSGGLLSPSRKGTELSAPIHVADWLPTFCELAGVSAAAGASGANDPRLNAIDGLSLAPLLVGSDEEAANSRTVQLRERPLLLLDDPGTPDEAQAIVKGRYKLVRHATRLGAQRRHM